VADVCVVNASPLIFLGATGKLDLLRLVAPRVLVPSSVPAEVRARGSTDPVAAAVDAASWLEHRPSTSSSPDAVLAWDLGGGESAVITLALESPGAVAILDDLPARRCAASLGIPVAGTLGIVLLARKAGRLPAARPMLEDLRNRGMWLSDRVLNTVLKEIGE